MQPDSLIPDPSNPQAWNRYSYAINNPVLYKDSSGHFAIIATIIVVGIVVVGWLAFAPPAYAPASATDLETRSNIAESSLYTKTARWIDDHPIKYVALVTGIVYGSKAVLGAVADSGGEKTFGPNSNTPVKQHPETKGENVKDTNVLDKWKEFLGEEPYSSKNPRTGEEDPNRITSSDGKRSIRYGPHEVSNPNRQHYHEENWEYDNKSGIMHYFNKAITIIKTRFRN